MKRLILFALLWLLAAAPARAEWRRAESPNFIVFSQGSEARLRERILLLEEFDRLLRLATATSAPPAENKLHVYLVDGIDDLRVLRPLGAGIGGFYTATPHGIAAFVDRQLRQAENEILFHEYAHHFMMQYAPGAYPPWYIEGFAEYFATARFEGDSIHMGNVSEGRGYSIVLGNWLPMERVLFGDLRGLNRDQAAQYYAQSWLTVHYFNRTSERQAALRRYLEAARQGDPREAFQAATGLTAAALREELRRYIGGGRISYLTITRHTREAPPAVTIAAMPAAADDLILYEAALRIGMVDSLRERSVQRIRQFAARHADDPFARRVLAHAELLYGDAATADRLLDPLLAAAPDDAGLMYLKALRHLMAAEKGDWESESREARRWFVRAHRADPNHFPTLYRYAQSLSRQPNYISENTSNILLLAHNLAPQVGEIRMNAAIMLMNRDQFAEAEALLRPVSNDPHNSGLAEAARQLIDQARARRRPGPAAEPAAEAEPEAEE